jgi:membrane-bound inhibitor of C-type lysozyme
MTGNFFRVRRLWAVSVMCLFFAAGAAFADELFVSAGGKNYILQREESVSGDKHAKHAKYAAADDPTTVFWSSADEAGLTIEGREYSRYVLIRLLPDEDEILLTVDGKNYRMKRVVSASGAKFEDVNDPATVFWSKGVSAMLTIKGKDYPDYESWEPVDVIWLPPEQ